MVKPASKKLIPDMGLRLLEKTKDNAENISKVPKKTQELSKAVVPESDKVMDYDTIMRTMFSTFDERNSTFLDKIPDSISKYGLVLRSIQPGNYLVYSQEGKTLGRCCISANTGFTEMPNIWIENNKVKPSVEICVINTLEHAKGIGRKIIQIVHELSKKVGYEGRICLPELEDASGFYTKLGFLGEGSRYFEPNKESLAKLYKTA